MRTARNDTAPLRPARHRARPSGMMSFLVSGIATARAIGIGPGFVTDWLSAWTMAWAVAFPTLAIFRPIVTRFIGGVTAKA